MHFNIYNIRSHNYTVKKTKTMTEDVATSTYDSEFEAIEKSSLSCIRKNAYGQVKANRNQKQPKPPLPPMKKTPKAPLRRSERNKAKTKEQVSPLIL